MAIAFVSISQLFWGDLKFDKFFPLLVLLGNRKTYTYLYGYRVYTLQSAAKHTTIVANVNKCTETTSTGFRITMALCHLMAIIFPW